MTALVLQARIDSSRLHGKALLPLAGKPMIFRVMEALNSFPCEIKVLACPDDSAAALAPLAEEAGFILITGPKEDVLKRYCNVIRMMPADRIIRATGDNPFVFSDAAIAINAEALEMGADYAGYLGLPHGAGVESVSAEALLRAEKEAESAEEREHVCPYLYNHPGLFQIHRPEAPLKWKAEDFRVTVDTAPDLLKAESLYAELSCLQPQERSLGENIIAAYKRIMCRETEPKT